MPGETTRMTLPARRAGSGPHPAGGDALRARVLGERGRIARMSRIRELVLGSQDGLLVPLGVVTGLAGASVSTTAILAGGVAEAAAGALGVIKGRVARLALARSGLQVLLVGGASAGLGYLIGSVGPRIVGV